MNLISAQAISKKLGEKTLLNEASFGIDERDRVGIIGINGCGKSTLLKILAGIEPHDSGTLARKRNLKVAMLTQNQPFDPTHTAIEHVFAGDDPRAVLMRRWEIVHELLEEKPGDHDLAHESMDLSHSIDTLGAWDFESSARTVLGRLGLKHLDRPMSTLSGGERKRADLAGALLAEPDILLLDEPTNHLDADLIEWLGDWLAAFPGAVAMVTHDRYFLDQVTNRIFEIDRAELRMFEGNFSYYLEKKAEIEADFAKKEDRRLNLVRRELEWLKRGAKARSTKQKARKDRALELIDTNFTRTRDKLVLETAARRMGKKVLELHDIAFGHPGAPLLIRDLEYTFTPMERLGIVGANGTGKTTLANLIVGRLKPTAGRIEVGPTVSMGYFDQESSGFKMDERAIDYVKRVGGEALTTADGSVMVAERFLDRFFITRQMQFSPVGKLSGGERRRLYLVAQLIRDPNFILLDEPTNDFDIPTLQALEEYLDGFAGVVVVISHDRYFLDRVVDQVIAPAGGGEWRKYPGGYSVYAEMRAQEEADARDAKKDERAAPVEPPPPAERKKLSFKEKTEFEKLEKEIPKIEKQLEQIGEVLAGAGLDYKKLKALTSDQANLLEKLESSTARWAELGERAE